MARGSQIAGAVKGCVYSAEVPAARAASDYTPRIIPYHPAARIPLEDARILWFR
jgi:starch phosphorylase